MGGHLPTDEVVEIIRPQLWLAEGWRGIPGGAEIKHGHFTQTVRGDNKMALVGKAGR